MPSLPQAGQLMGSHEHLEHRQRGGGLSRVALERVLSRRARSIRLPSTTAGASRSAASPAGASLRQGEAVRIASTLPTCRASRADRRGLPVVDGCDGLQQAQADVGPADEQQRADSVGYRLTVLAGNKWVGDVEGESDEAGEDQQPAQVGAGWRWRRGVPDAGCPAAGRGGTGRQRVRLNSRIWALIGGRPDRFE